MRGASWWVSFVVVLAGCSGGDDSSNGNPPAPILKSGSPDAGTFAYTDDGGSDAGELLSPCEPGNPSSCPTGFTCYAEHTDAGWWVDLYGKCTFDCNGQTYPLCDSLDGVCGCPLPEIGDAASPCLAAGGPPMLCVPAVRPTNDE